jgi:hypothetical protein
MLAVFISPLFVFVSILTGAIINMDKCSITAIALDLLSPKSIPWDGS